MTYEVFQNISKIIERDSKSTTYKFALLRGVIDIIQENSPFIIIEDDRVEIPTGLLVEKWLVYYYPILESSINIPQIYGSANLAFENQFKELITKYSSIGGFSAFYNDLMKDNIPKVLQSEFYDLALNISKVIVDKPMRHLAYSVNEKQYSIFEDERKIKKQDIPKAGVNQKFLIESLGSFSIPRAYYDAFAVLGPFLIGQNSLVFKWAEFSVKASKNGLSIGTAIDKILKKPID